MPADPELGTLAERAQLALLALANDAGDALTGEERDMIGLIRQACHEIQDGDRDDA